VNDYLLANPLNYGSPLKVAPDKKKVEYPGSNARAVLNALERMYMKFPTPQLFEVSDAPKSDKGGAPVVPVKPVIEHALTDFLKTSRAQDHLIVFFSGHIAKDDKDDVYLVPVEGDLQDSKTLIGLSWVFDKMKACPARQKVLILDVCRF